MLNFWQAHVAPSFAFSYFLYIFSYCRSPCNASLLRENTVETEHDDYDRFLQSLERQNANDKKIKAILLFYRWSVDRVKFSLFQRKELAAFSSSKSRCQEILRRSEESLFIGVPPCCPEVQF